MPLLNFQDRFAPKVQSGEKLHSIRKRRKRRPKVGQTMHLYNQLRKKGGGTKLRLDLPKCTDVQDIEIHWRHVIVDGRKFSRGETNTLAKKDGFDTVKAFFDFWETIHGLSPDNPLTNFDLIKWEPLSKEAFANGS